jgi:4-hydroxybenzoate polyprenyltransferase
MRAEPRWDRLALLAGLLIGNQYAAGALNDAVDADADAAAGRDKPIQRGVIGRRAVATAAVVAGAASLAFGAALGPATLALAVVGLACAWSYDLWL